MTLVLPANSPAHAPGDRAAARSNHLILTCTSARSSHHPPSRFLIHQRVTSLVAVWHLGPRESLSFVGKPVRSGPSSRWPLPSLFWRLERQWVAASSVGRDSRDRASCAGNVSTGFPGDPHDFGAWAGPGKLGSRRVTAASGLGRSSRSAPPVMGRSPEAATRTPACWVTPVGELPTWPRRPATSKDAPRGTGAAHGGLQVQSPERDRVDARSVESRSTSAILRTCRGMNRRSVRAKLSATEPHCSEGRRTMPEPAGLIQSDTMKITTKGPPRD